MLKTIVRSKEGLESSEKCDEIAQPPVTLSESPATIERAGVHVGVVKIYLALHAALFAVLFATFSVDGEASFMVAISAFYLFMYLGVPYVVLSWIGGKRLTSNSSWSDFLDSPHDTFTGSVKGIDALAQICLVPGAVLIGMSGICLIINHFRGA